MLSISKEDFKGFLKPLQGHLYRAGGPQSNYSRGVRHEELRLRDLGFKQNLEGFKSFEINWIYSNTKFYVKYVNINKYL